MPPLNNGIPDKSANIHLGSFLGDVNSKNVTIRGNQIGGAAQVGIYAQTGAFLMPNQNILIEDNNITAAETGILFENTIASEIVGNRISGVNGSVCAPGVGVGIQLSGSLPWNTTASSSCNAVLNNTVSNNITGILIEQGAQGNLLDENKVFNNSKCQILNRNKKRNVLEDNITFKKPKCNPCKTQSTTLAKPIAQSRGQLLQSNLPPSWIAVIDVLKQRGLNCSTK